MKQRILSWCKSINYLRHTSSQKLEKNNLITFINHLLLCTQYNTIVFIKIKKMIDISIFKTLYLWIHHSNNIILIIRIII